MFTFTFNGEDFSSYGLTVLRRPELNSPQARMEFANVDGYDGAYTYNTGLTSYDMNMEISVEGFDNMRMVSGLLQGKGSFTRSDLPKRVIEVFIGKTINFTKKAHDLYVGTVEMTATDPLWYDEDDYVDYDSYELEENLPYDTPLRDGVTVIINNRGNAPSKPIIHLFGRGEVEFSLNGTSMTYHFPANESNVRIDCETYEALHQKPTEREVTGFENVSLKKNSVIGLTFEELKGSKTFNRISSINPILIANHNDIYVPAGYSGWAYWLNDDKRVIRTAGVYEKGTIELAGYGARYLALEIKKDRDVAIDNVDGVVLPKVGSYVKVLSRRNVYLSHSFKFPTLDVGDNELKVTKGEARIYVQYKDAWY